MPITPSGFADFEDTDESFEAIGLLRFLDRAEELDFFREVRRRSFESLAVGPGDSVLSVGCGTGRDVRELAGLVGAGGRVVGVDRSEFLLRKARERAAGLPQVSFVRSDAGRLDFPDAGFDACRSERVFMYLNDRHQAFAELLRVARPGARISMFDADMEGWMIDSPDRATTRRVMNFWCDGIADGWMGRRWAGLFREFGLADITVEPMTLVVDDFDLVADVFLLRRTLGQAVDQGVLELDEARRWLADLEARGRAGRFFFATTNLLVSGRKP
ncbi:MAG: methyltransferase domain-containing protein [Isosphaeraceae bacterium]